MADWDFFPGFLQLHVYMLMLLTGQEGRSRMPSKNKLWAGNIFLVLEIHFPLWHCLSRRHFSTLDRFVLGSFENVHLALIIVTELKYEG